VGQTVARLEGEIVLSALAHRVDSIELTAEPRLLLNNTLRGWSSLPIAVGSRAP
jgi:4-methoxybenzoate monooxygenase (O-demethylating)